MRFYTHVIEAEKEGFKGMVSSKQKTIGRTQLQERQGKLKCQEHAFHAVDPHTMLEDTFFIPP